MVFRQKVFDVLVVLFAVCVAYSVSQRVKSNCPADDFGKWWQDESTPCSKEYEVCRSFVWRKSVCILGHFNYTTGRCQTFNDGSGCTQTDNSDIFPNVNVNGRRKRDVSALSENSEATEVEHRYKRQADNCANEPKYPCPDQITRVIIYPDWDDSSCTNYYVCLKGQLKKLKCPQDIDFYNPRLQSCEEYPGLSNTCVWRFYANYAPFDGNTI